MALCDSWRGRQAALAFTWGTSATAATERLRPSFVGKQVVDPVSGQAALAESTCRLALRYAFSALISVGCLLGPVAVMFASLNLQGYISPRAKQVLGFPVYFPSMAAHAQPGGVFDPEGHAGLVPVILHAVTISILNTAYRAVAHRLTRLENHRTDRSFE